MIKTKRRTQNQKGQATLEMIFALTILLGMIFFQVQVALVLAFGNYVQYATFMAARAYQSAGGSEQDSMERARAVLVAMLKKNAGQAGVDRWPAIAKGVGGDDVVKGAEIGLAPEASNAGPGASSWMQGVRYTFQSRLFFFSLEKDGGSSASNSRQPAGSVTLKSESWLGRDPANDACLREMSRLNAPMLDNGC